ncbi:hypothetical protein VMCG_04944 [Cytospora schulzeri]|uniref:Uncharacterized protein n=1 Tax=Cytospora schulzeri TaxID=448051 RepID=A0A423WMJ2_9PEZI|nr:hypothetical protein VMCG_04944 [Valsa malicola]
MDTGQSPTGNTTTSLQYQQAPGPNPSTTSHPPGFPPLPSRPSMYGAYPNPQVPAGADATNLTGRPEQSYPRPVRVYSPQEVPANIKAARSSVEYGLGQLRSLQHRRYRPDEVGVEERLRIQAASVLGDLRVLRGEVSDLIRAAERHRWRKWLLGGVIAALVPAVRTLWQRPRHDHPSSSNTEYAFLRSKSLIQRILRSLRKGLGGLATVTFFVFAVLYVFQNEVSLRVARTMSKRLKRLSAKIERGDEELNEADVKLLRGWRWRVLLWDH